MTEPEDAPGPKVQLCVVAAPIWVTDLRPDASKPLLDGLIETGVPILAAMPFLGAIDLWRCFSTRLALAPGPARYRLDPAAGGAVVYLRADAALRHRMRGAALPAPLGDPEALAAIGESLREQAAAAGLLFHETREIGAG